jgi:hypothetical protein
MAARWFDATGASADLSSLQALSFPFSSFKGQLFCYINRNQAGISTA